MRTGVLEWAYAARTLAGQSETGDRYLVRPVGRGVLIAAIDGLGHGHEASRASEEGTATLASFSGDEPLSQMMRGCHAALRDTRGATMSLARFDDREGAVAWLGVGNVEGRLARRTPGGSRRDESLLLRPGVVGDHLPQLRESVLPMARGDVIALVTDGIEPRSAEEIDTRQSPADTAEGIIERGATGNDDALVLVARYMG